MTQAVSKAVSKAVVWMYALDPALPVLLRPDGAVQVGWDPRRAVLIRPPCGLAAAELASLLRSMRSPTPISELQRQAVDRGLRDARFGPAPVPGVSTRAAAMSSRAGSDLGQL